MLDSLITTTDTTACKVYSLKYFMERHRKQTDFFNEYAIMKLATANQLVNVIHLQRTYLSPLNVSIESKLYQMDFRVYLRNHRKPKHLNDILLQVLNGIKEIHSIGYVHRDLKPENIVLNLKPFEVRIIDFNTSVPQEADTVDSIRGTPGYHPAAPKWYDGSTQWDIYSLATLMLEADMDKDLYYNTKDEKQIRYNAT